MNPSIIKTHKLEPEALKSSEGQDTPQSYRLDLSNNERVKSTQNGNKGVNSIFLGIEPIINETTRIKHKKDLYTMKKNPEARNKFIGKKILLLPPQNIL